MRLMSGCRGVVLWVFDDVTCGEFLSFASCSVVIWLVVQKSQLSLLRRCRSDVELFDF